MQLPSSLRSVTHRPSHAAAISPPGLGLSLGDDRGKPRLLGITKRGSKYLRKMLIQGARAGLPILNRCNTRLGQWLRGLLATAHCRPDPKFRGYGYTPYFVEGDEPEKMHELMAATLNKVVRDIQRQVIEFLIG